LTERGTSVISTSFMENKLMTLIRFGLLGALATMLALPAAAQTPQGTPAKPSPTLTTPAKPTAAPAASKPAAASSTLVDINSASSEDLDRLPGIGKFRADAIIKNRPYKGKDDLLDRKIVPANVYKGIKDKIIAKQS
jgi:competence protein ComEA